MPWETRKNAEILVVNSAWFKRRNYFPYSLWQLLWFENLKIYVYLDKPLSYGHVIFILS